MKVLIKHILKEETNETIKVISKYYDVDTLPPSIKTVKSIAAAIKSLESVYIQGGVATLQN